MSAQQQTIIPAYFYPGPLWDQAIAGGATVSTLIMNPASGPGGSRNIDYVNAVAKAQAAGINVIGYVHTSYGVREPQLVKQEVDAYYNWYGVDGIFLDETASSAAQLAYYDSICAHIRARAGSPLVVLNPGVYPDEAYVNLADVLIVFESTYLKYQTSTPPAWVFNYPPEKFYHIVYDTPLDTQLTDSISRSRANNAKYVYITDDVLDNPFDRLPRYWANELYQLGNTVKRKGPKRR